MSGSVKYLIIVFDKYAEAQGCLNEDFHYQNVNGVYRLSGRIQADRTFAGQ